MDAILTIRSDDLDDAGLQRLTDDLCQTLNQEGGIDASPATQPYERGMKSTDPIALGQIALALVGSGGVIVTLINVLNAYVSRANHLEVEIKNENGESIKITGDHLRPEQLRQTTRLIHKFLGVRE